MHATRASHISLIHHEAQACPSLIVIATRTHSVLTQVLSLMEDLRRRPSGRAKIPVLNTFAKAGDVENTKRIVAMYTAQGHTPDVEVKNIILSAYINHPAETMWEEIKKFYNENYGQKNCKADYHTFRFLLRACEKYRNCDAAFAWYKEALDLNVSTAGLKSILR